MANVIVQVLSARYLFDGKTYAKGETFEIPADPSARPKGLNGSIERGNLVLVGAVDAAAKPKAGNVQVDLGAVPSTPVEDPTSWPDPRTTNVTGNDFVTENPEDIPEIAPDDVIGNALKSAIKENISKPAVKTSRSKKQ